MTTYTIQLNTSYPVPKYRTFETMYDPVPIAGRREVVKVDEACSDHAEQARRDSFENYLNQHSMLTAERSEKGQRFDPAKDIEAESIYLTPPAAEEASSQGAQTPQTRPDVQRD